MMKLNENEKLVANYVMEKVGPTATKREILDASLAGGFEFDNSSNKPTFMLNKKLRVSRGVYRNPLAGETVKVKEPDSVAALVTVDDFNVDNNGFAENLVPTEDPLFVPFGNFSTV